ncbi:MAG: hypothetical protein H6Q48_1887 [Deltaproteobacteria bacterium]|jgi:hypothetical protein|nr:hypothetical protein [Deltaproteobacteria bacterium]
MDVLVPETLKGGLLDSGMVLQIGDGMHNRPTLDLFRPGSDGCPKIESMSFSVHFEGGYEGNRRRPVGGPGRKGRRSETLCVQSLEREEAWLIRTRKSLAGSRR